MENKYNIRQVGVYGESGDVHSETVDSWKERLPEILSGYSKENLRNMDETGVFWKALPDHGFGVRGRAAMVVRRTNNVLQLPFSSQQLVLNKSLLLYADLKSHNA